MIRAYFHPLFGTGCDSPRKKFSRGGWEFLRAERGSATVELIALGIPLFLPIAIYLVAVDGASSVNFEARNFSRQVARAYVTSSDEQNAQARISAIEGVFNSEVFNRHQMSINSTIEISCSSDPCLTPGGVVRVSVSLSQAGRGEVARASTVETVDQWR